MDDDGAELRPEPLEGQVTRAMETARRRAGLTVEAMVRRLRPALRLPDVPPEKKDIRNNWYQWRARPQSISAVALVAAAKLAGTSVDSLLAEAGDAMPGGRLARLEREVAEQQRMITELRQAIGDRASNMPRDRQASR